MAAKSLRPPAHSMDELRRWFPVLCGELYSRALDNFELHEQWPKTLVVCKIFCLYK
jgi:hypothetical protein